MQSILNTFSGIACAMLIIYFFMYLADRVSRDMLSFDRLVNMMIRFVIAFAILLFLPDIYNGKYPSA